MPAYSRILLPWDSQPQEAAGVDLGNPLAQGLKFAAIPLGPVWIDLVSGALAENTNAQDFAKTSAPLKRAGAPAGRGTVGLTTGHFRFPIGLPIDKINGPWTMFTESGITNAANRLKAFSSNDALIGSGIGLEFDDFSSVNNGFSAIVNEGAGGQVRAASTGNILGTSFENFTHRIGVSSDNANIWFYANGVFDRTQASASTPALASTRRTKIGGQFDTTTTTGQLVNPAVCLAWDRVLSAAEHAAIAQNPWQLFAPRTIWVPVSAGGGGTSISGALGAAVASGFTGAINANRSIVGALGAATASGFTGTVSNSTNTAITGALGVATASGFKGTVGANRGIAGAFGVAVASGFTGAVTNDNSTTISGALGTATASGFTGAITWNRYIAGLLGEAQASGFAGGVQNGAAPVIASGGGIYPTPRRKTKQEIDEDRKRLGILPDEPEVQTGIVETPKRPKITLEQLIGKPAADTHRADMERASAAHKLRKRRQDDDLLMMM